MSLILLSTSLIFWTGWAGGDHSETFSLEHSFMAHVILVSNPVPIELWIFDCFGFGIGIRSRGTRLGTGA